MIFLLRRLSLIKYNDFIWRSKWSRYIKKDYLMPTFREAGVFQNVGEVALAHPKLPSFLESVPCVSNETIGIHFPFFIFFFPCFDKYGLFSWIHIES